LSTAGVCWGSSASRSVGQHEAAEIEWKLERGELSREQADKEQVKLFVNTVAGFGGAWAGAEAGAMNGTFLCPVYGTVADGFVGTVAAYYSAEMTLVATGLDDTLPESLQPGVNGVRQAYDFVNEKDIAVKVTSYDRLREWFGPKTSRQIGEALRLMETRITSCPVGNGPVRGCAVVAIRFPVKAAETEQQKAFDVLWQAARDQLNTETTRVPVKADETGPPTLINSAWQLLVRRS
jgi:hypothetical protein